ncbi:MAG TPA: acetone carboxylase subunit gamma, partial [Burkholderiaceae bacterium]|nr:acetone carboxylase subunit gamma [Burkholderiaceae bacterium]
AATREERRGHPRAAALPLRPLGGKLLREVTANLAVRSDPAASGKARKRWCCIGCANDLGPLGGNYKDACAMLEAPITASNPHVGDYRRYIDDEPVFRQYFCPACGRLIENEIARVGDPPLRDIELSA